MLKVLIVEDEQSQAEVLTMLLNLEGFDVETAPNGKEALDKLEEVKPDLIITDFMMPGMNGGEMAERIRGTRSHCRLPIIMTSATDVRQVETFARHYDAFFRKPYRWNDVFAAIQRLLHA